MNNRIIKKLTAVSILCAMLIGVVGCGKAIDLGIKVGSLKGPTTMGLVNLMQLSEEGSKDAELDYTFDVAADPSEITAKIASGELDVALIPANAAAVLYNKTNGGISVISINTLGVLDCITGDESIKSFKDLDGKTVLTTGQGATPEYAIKYLSEVYGTTDIKVEFLSEATEVAAKLAEDPNQIAILPQPFATAVTLKNDKLKKAFSLTDEWDAAGTDSRLITGVTVVRNEYLQNHPILVETFLDELEESVNAAAADPEKTAGLIVKYGILENDKAALKALPECNIVYIKGQEMKDSLSGYLQTLYDAAPESVGGSLPGDDFYYIYE